MTHITKEGLLQAIEESLCVYNGEKAWGRSPAWVFDRATELSAQESKPVALWITKLKRELRMSAMKSNFTFTRDETIELLGGVEALLEAPVSAQDASPKDDGYKDAWYEIAYLLGIGAQNASPKEVHANQIMPRLRALREMEAASPKDGWIKCSKRLPEFGEIVFLLSGNSIFAGARSDPDEDGWVWANQTMAWRLNDPDGLEDDDSEPTHWRPMFSLPEPPHD